MEVVTSITSLVSVLASATIAIISLRKNDQLQEDSRRQQLALSLLPRRLAAFEVAWNVVYSVEETGGVPEEMLQSLVQLSLWLPHELRTNVLRLSSGNSEAQTFAAIRQQLTESSGSGALGEYMVTRVIDRTTTER